MAIEKLTLFELHFEDAQFGPRQLESGGAAGEGTEAEEERGEETSGGRRFLALFAASTLLAVGATLLARRLFGDDEQTTVDEFAVGPVDTEESIEVGSEDATA